MGAFPPPVENQASAPPPRVARPRREAVQIERRVQLVQPPAIRQDLRPQFSRTSSRFGFKELTRDQDEDEGEDNQPRRPRLLGKPPGKSLDLILLSVIKLLSNSHR